MLNYSQFNRIIKFAKRLLLNLVKVFYLQTGKNLKKFLGRNNFAYKTYHLLLRICFENISGHSMYVLNGHKMSLNSYNASYFMLGEYEPETTKTFKSLIKKGDVVVDVGANIGYYTLLSARAVGNKGKVFSFEPDLMNYSLLEKNVEINGYKNIVLVKKAVSDKNSIERFYINSPNTNSLIFSEDQSEKSINVETIKLDDYFNDNKIKIIKLVKLDIEGAEALALNGMKKLIRENKIISIITEYNPLFLRKQNINPNTFIKEIIDSGFEIKVIEGLEENINVDIFQLDNYIKKGSGINLLCLRY